MFTYLIALGRWAYATWCTLTFTYYTYNKAFLRAYHILYNVHTDTVSGLVIVNATEQKILSREK